MLGRFRIFVPRLALYRAIFHARFLLSNPYMPKLFNLQTDPINAFQFNRRSNNISPPLTILHDNFLTSLWSFVTLFLILLCFEIIRSEIVIFRSIESSVDKIRWDYCARNIRSNDLLSFELIAVVRDGYSAQ